MRHKFAQSFMIVLVALTLGATVLSAIYLIHLDRAIVEKFDSKRFRLASKVYARPMEIFTGKYLNLSDLKKELSALGYLEREEVKQPEEFSAKKNLITIYRREFTFFEGNEPAVLFKISLQGNTISDITDSKGQPLDMIRMDPLQIGGIYPNNPEERELVTLDKVPQKLIDGLLLLEDEAFYNHGGIAPLAILRAMLVNLRAGKVTQGGSTLTQQLIKNFYLNSERTFYRKIREMIYALLLELHYSKQEILETYINEVYLGQNGPVAIHGFSLAAQFYFSKPLGALSLSEQATLIAMVNGPSYFNPHRHPKRVATRRDKVLRLLKEEKKITDTEFAEALKTPVIAQSKPSNFFSSYLDLVKMHIARDYKVDDLMESGLNIHTGCNPTIQWIAQNAVDKEFTNQHGNDDDDLNIAVVVTNLDGEVEAVIGGKKPLLLGFNRAINASRSIGSLVKPILVAGALENPSSFSLATMLDDSPTKVTLDNKKTWVPQNFDHTSHGMVPLYEALAYSYNLAMVDLGQRIGLKTLSNTLTRLLGEDLSLQNPSAFLGSISLSPYQITQVYQTIANNGFRSPLNSVRHVLGRDLKPLKSFELKTKKVLRDDVSYLVNFAMRQVIQIGTGRGAQRWIHDISNVAGKSGTSSEGKDLWFSGFNGSHVVTVWVGTDSSSSTRFTGSSLALPVWSRIMSELSGRAPLQPPENIDFAWIHKTTGGLTDQNCENAIFIPFVSDSEPSLTVDCNGNSTSVLKTFIDKLLQ